MTGPSKCSPHGWTLDAIAARLDALEKMLEEREHRTKERFDNARENVSAALASSEKAIIKAEVADNKRFDSVNEFRATLADQAERLLPRGEYSVQYAALVEKMEDTSAKIDAINLVLTNRIDINTRIIEGLNAMARGKKEGISVIGAVVLGVISALSAAAAIAAVIVAAYNIRH